MALTDRRIVLWGLITCLLLSLLAYYHLGYWREIRIANLQDQLQHSATPEQHRALYSKLLMQITLLLDRRPKQYQYWLLKGNLLVDQQQFDPAAKSYLIASQLHPTDMDLLARYVEAQFVANGYQLNGELETMIDTILQSDPQHNHIRSANLLTLRGIIAYQQQDYSQAIVNWQQALAILPTDHSRSDFLRKNIAIVKAHLDNAIQ